MSLLLVPGFMADETLWRDLEAPLARFAPLHYADLRHDSSIEAMARRALDAAPPSFLLVGFSMGGYVAREIARLAPERVRALVLIATSTRPDTPALRQRKGAIGQCGAVDRLQRLEPHGGRHAHCIQRTATTKR
jgi:pimeloyl-ACP methyl ester carboxylesterase